MAGLKALWRAFKAHPVSTLLTLTSALLGVLVYVQETGLITGKMAGWLAGAIGLLNLLLGMAAHMHVTPLAKPRAADGTPLVPRGSQYPIR